MLIGGRSIKPGFIAPLKTGVLDFNKNNNLKWTIYPEISAYENSDQCSSEQVFDKNGKR